MRRFYKLPAQFIKKVLKKSIAHLGKYALSQPRLKRFCLRMLENFPLVRNKLASVVYGSENNSKNIYKILEYAHLSPLGRDVYAMLLAAQEKRKIG